MTKHDVHSTKAPEPVGPYPHAKRVGSLVFFSGVGPRQRGTKEIPGVTLNPDGSVGAKDIEAQCRSCFNNLKTVCEEAGVPWTSIADVTVFLTDMKADFGIYNQVYAQYFAGPGNPNPTRTTIEINALPTPIAVEVKAIAVVG
jgi:2-aminomuconate deaminase